MRLAIVFGTAEETRDLFAWALLERIEITPDKTTNYTFTGLKLFEGRKRLKSALRKKSNREPLDENFIRPYAICYTPEFLMDSEIGHTPHSAQDVMPNKQRGKEIAKSWGLSVQRALYRKTGDWYHVLTKFPGALLDADGYVIFEREESFKACPQLLIGKDPARHGGWVSASPGIKAIPGYAYVTDRPFVESLLRPSVPARGQTWGGSTEARKAIESHAMDLAVRHYVSLWQEVLDVSATEPFDLLCREGESRASS